MSAHRAATDLFKAPVELADPGNAGSIYVERSPCVVNLVSAGAETRTVAPPTEPGALLLLNAFTIGGTITVTVTGGYDPAGSTALSVTAVKQYFLLQSVQESAGVYRWRLLAAHTTFPSAVTGVAAGYKLARGVTALDGSNPTPVVTGLTTVVAAMVSLEGTAAPGVGTSVLTVASTNYATGALAVYAWKVTATNDATLIASTGTENFEWVAIGT
jgi:hypothetical protein